VLFLYVALAPLAKAVLAQDALWSASAICRAMPAGADGEPSPSQGSSVLHDLSCCLPGSRYDLADDAPGCVPFVFAIAFADAAIGIVPIPPDAPFPRPFDLLTRPARAPPALTG